MLPTLISTKVSVFSSVREVKEMSIKIPGRPLSSCWTLCCRWMILPMEEMVRCQASWGAAERAHMVEEVAEARHETDAAVSCHSGARTLRVHYWELSSSSSQWEWCSSGRDLKQTNISQSFSPHLAPLTVISWARPQWGDQVRTAICNKGGIH